MLVLFSVAVFLAGNQQGDSASRRVDAVRHEPRRQQDTARVPCTWLKISLPVSGRWATHVYFFVREVHVLGSGTKLKPA